MIAGCSIGPSILRQCKTLRALGRGGANPSLPGGFAQEEAPMLDEESRDRDLAGMLSHTPATRLAEGLMLGFAWCDEDGYHLSDLQKMQLLKAALLSYDGTEEDLRAQVERNRTAQESGELFVLRERLEAAEDTAGRTEAELARVGVDYGIQRHWGATPGERAVEHARVALVLLKAGLRELDADADAAEHTAAFGEVLDLAEELAKRARASEVHSDA